MKRTWARCANCNKATWYCSRHGCRPKVISMYLGMADISFSSMGSNLVVIADSEASAKRLLLVKYNGVRREYGAPLFASFEELADWNGAAVRKLTVGEAVIWERLP